jgi:antitoxin ParD1/3/4
VENCRERGLTIDSIYSSLAAMNIALTKHFEALIGRLISSGRYNNASEVVRAGLRNLEAEEQALAHSSFPPGSLRHLYGKWDNRAERRTARASTLKIEAQ